MISERWLNDETRKAEKFPVSFTQRKTKKTCGSTTCFIYLTSINHFAISFKGSVIDHVVSRLLNYFSLNKNKIYDTHVDVSLKVFIGQ